jgi:hypothetical protein
LGTPEADIIEQKIVEIKKMLSSLINKLKHSDS